MYMFLYMCMQCSTSHRLEGVERYLKVGFYPFIDLSGGRIPHLQYVAAGRWEVCHCLGSSRTVRLFPQPSKFLHVEKF